MTISIVHQIDSAKDEICFALRSTIYGRHYGNIPIDSFVDEFDRFDEHGQRRSHLLGAWSEKELLGTCRLIHYVLSEFKPDQSEIANLFDIDWQCLADIVGVPKQSMHVAEIGKFAIASCTEAIHVKKGLLRNVGFQAISMGADIVLAVMTPQVERTAARRAGAIFHRTTAQIRRDQTDVKKLMLKHHDYFLPGLRKYGLDPAMDEVETASDTALDMVIYGLKDGPSLWWILPTQLASL